MAIRSNSKAAKAAIREYVKKTLALRSDEWTRFEQGNDLADTCRAYCDYLDRIFKNDYVLKYTSQRISHDIDGGGAWEIGTWERALLIGEWLQEDEATLDRFYEQGKVDEMFRYLITREVIQLAGRY